jgi:hypothetical protein
MKLGWYVLLFASFVLLIGIVLVDRAFATSDASQTNAVVKLPEGNDFATRVLGDPWDMYQLSDVSKALNNSGRSDYVQNFQVNNGIFSGYSTSTNYANFYVLWAGYEYGMDIGKVGARYPIDTNVYRCLYVRMQVDSPISDVWYAGWIPNDVQYIGPNNGGVLWPIYLHNSSLPVGSWQVYSVDLVNPVSNPSDPAYPGYIYENWADRAEWQGLRIHPTNTANTHFQVDWVRLTDCVPVNYQVTWNLQAGQTKLWAGIGGQQKDILVTSLNASQTNYIWDVQGLEPGQYYLGVEANGQVTWLSQSLFIEPAPIAEFTKPSPYSGEDFSTSRGNPWDFSDASDLISTSCFDWFVSNGIFDLTTLAPDNMPSQCLGAIGEVDSRFQLNLLGGYPTGSQYRYLSFRHSIDGQLERSADGMIGRWIWRYNGCTQVSEDIPYDVGWHTYTIDLYNPSLGFAEEAVGCGRNYWVNSGAIDRLRFDPNENWTGNLVPAMTFHQQFDWIRLTKVDQAYQGVPFPIQVSLNKSPGTIQQIQFYYTDNINNPTRFPAGEHLMQPSMGTLLMTASDSEVSVVGDYQIFLPVVMQKYTEVIPPPTVENEILFWWDTSSVPPGEYYTCAVTSDGYNQTTFCSEAPVKILP